MSDNDIEKAVKDAAEFDAQDKARKEAIDTRNDADSFVFQTEKALTDVGDKISEEERTSLETDLKELKDLLESTKDAELTPEQVIEMKALQEKLAASAQALFTKMYEEQAAAQGGAGPDMGGAAGPDMGGATGPDMGGTQESSPEDDVVDADFREV
jgi:molecular chaperone DnaK